MVGEAGNFPHSSGGDGVSPSGHGGGDGDGGGLAAEGELMDFFLVLQQTQQNLEAMLVDLQTAKLELDLANERADAADSRALSASAMAALEQQRAHGLQAAVTELELREAALLHRAATSETRSAELSTRLQQSDAALYALQARMEARIQREREAITATTQRRAGVDFDTLLLQLSQAQADRAGAETRATKSELDLAVMRSRLAIAQQNVTVGAERLRQVEQRAAAAEEAAAALRVALAATQEDGQRLQQQLDAAYGKLAERDDRLRQSARSLLGASATLRKSYAVQCSLSMLRDSASDGHHALLSSSVGQRASHGSALLLRSSRQGACTTAAAAPATATTDGQVAGQTDTGGLGGTDVASLISRFSSMMAQQGALVRPTSLHSPVSSPSSTVEKATSSSTMVSGEAAPRYRRVRPANSHSVALQSAREEAVGAASPGPGRDVHRPSGAGKTRYDEVSDEVDSPDLSREPSRSLRDHPAPGLEGDVINPELKPGRSLCDQPAREPEGGEAGRIQHSTDARHVEMSQIGPSSSPRVQMSGSQTAAQASRDGAWPGCGEAALHCAQIPTDMLSLSRTFRTPTKPGGTAPSLASRPARDCPQALHKHIAASNANSPTNTSNCHVASATSTAPLVGLGITAAPSIATATSHHTSALSVASTPPTAAAATPIMTASTSPMTAVAAALPAPASPTTTAGTPTVTPGSSTAAAVPIMAAAPSPAAAVAGGSGGWPNVGDVSLSLSELRKRVPASALRTSSSAAKQQQQAQALTMPGTNTSAFVSDNPTTAADQSCPPRLDTLTASSASATGPAASPTRHTSTTTITQPATTASAHSGAARRALMVYLPPDVCAGSRSPAGRPGAACADAERCESPCSIDEPPSTLEDVEDDQDASLVPPFSAPPDIRPRPNSRGRRRGVPTLSPASDAPNSSKTSDAGGCCDGRRAGRALSIRTRMPCSPLKLASFRTSGVILSSSFANSGVDHSVEGGGGGDTTASGRLLRASGGGLRLGRLSGARPSHRAGLWAAASNRSMDADMAEQQFSQHQHGGRRASREGAGGGGRRVRAATRSNGNRAQKGAWERWRGSREACAPSSPSVLRGVVVGSVAAFGAYTVLALATLLLGGGGRQSGSSSARPRTSRRQDGPGLDTEVTPHT